MYCQQLDSSNNQQDTDITYQFTLKRIDMMSAKIIEVDYTPTCTLMKGIEDQK